MPELPSAPEQLAGALRRAIAMGTFDPGERLPNERTLADRFGASRMTVRAAIRTLVAEGLLTTSRGRNGGAVVDAAPSAYGDRPPDGAAIERFVEKVHDNLEVRLAVEPLAAELAALKASDDERAELLAIVDRAASGIRHYRLLDSRLHLVIARASGNRPLVEIIERLRTEFFLWADAAWLLLDWEVLAPLDKDFGASHRQLAESIAAGDAKLARELTHGHVEEGLTQVKAVLASAVRAPAVRTAPVRPAAVRAPGVRAPGVRSDRQQL